MSQPNPTAELHLTPWPEVARLYNAAHGTSYTPRAVQKIAERALRKMRDALVSNGVDRAYISFMESVRYHPTGPDINLGALLPTTVPTKYADDPNPFRSLNPKSNARRKRR